MDLKRLCSNVRKAIDDYNLINENDKIAVGVSGGKDSIALLYALASIRKYYPKNFELYAITVDLGFENFDVKNISKICSDLDVEHIIVNTQIAKIVFEERKEENPCSLCAKLRKGALNDELKTLNINKVAYAHHMDDVIETLMLSLIYEGRFQTICPKYTLDKTNITVIRPLIYVKEVDVIGFINKMNILIQPKSCPNDGKSKREYIKNLIRSINIDNPGVKKRMFTAILNSDLEGWNDGNN